MYTYFVIVTEQSNRNKDKIFDSSHDTRTRDAGHHRASDNCFWRDNSIPLSKNY